MEVTSEQDGFYMTIDMHYACILNTNHTMYHGWYLFIIMTIKSQRKYKPTLYGDNYNNNYNNIIFRVVLKILDTTVSCIFRYNCMIYEVSCIVILY